MKANGEETMNQNLDQAIENKEVHMNCCQSVFCSQCEKFGISKSVAYHLGAFFNAGMRHGEVCGACSGALMVLGMKYGDADNQKCKESLKFLKAFEEHFGTILCRDLVKKFGKPSCPTMIAFATEYLEQHLNE